MDPSANARQQLLELCETAAEFVTVSAPLVLLALTEPAQGDCGAAREQLRAACGGGHLQVAVHRDTLRTACQESTSVPSDAAQSGDSAAAPPAEAAQVAGDPPRRPRKTR